MTELSDALNTQGLKFLAANNFPTAIEFFRTAIAAEPDMADAHTNLGVSLFMHHEFEEAERVLRHSLSLRPDHPETLLNLGYALWRLDDMEGAKDAFHQAISSGMPNAYTALGSVYWETGDADKAMAYCREGLRRLPDDILGNDTLR